MGNVDSQIPPPTFPVDRSLEIVRQLIAAFQAHRVPFCHFKSNVRLPRTMAGMTDLDILVDRRGSSRVRHALADADFKPFISPPRRRYPGIQDWLGLDVDSGTMVHLHLHDQLITGIRFVKQYRLDIEDLLLASSRPDPETGMPVPDPSLELIVYGIREELRLSRSERLMKWAIRRTSTKAVREEYEYLRDRSCAADVIKFGVAVFGAAGGEITAARLLSATPTGADRQAFRQLVHKRFLPTRRICFCQAAARHGLGYAAHVFHSLGWVPNEAWKGKRSASGGLTVAIVGCDGSGKSTLERELLVSLRRQWDVRSYYMGSGDGSLPLVLRTAKQIWKSIRGSAVNKAGPGPSAADLERIQTRRQSRLYSVAQTCFALRLAMHRLHLAQSANRFRINGGIGLMVRFPQLQTPAMNDGPRLPAAASGWRGRAARLERSLLERVTRHGPDLLLLLDIPLEEARTRRPGVEPGYLEQKRNSLLQLTWGRTTVVRIDATLPIEEVRRKALHAIWGQL